VDGLLAQTENLIDFGDAGRFAAMGLNRRQVPKGNPGCRSGTVKTGFSKL
jgi:hypothetical protein